MKVLISERKKADNKAIAMILIFLSLWPISIPFLFAILVTLFFLIIPKQDLIYNADSASKAGYSFAQNILSNSSCKGKSLFLSKNELVISEEHSEHPIRYHFQVFEVQENDQVIGEFGIFLYDSIKILGMFPIASYELIYQDTRCKNE